MGHLGAYERYRKRHLVHREQEGSVTRAQYLWGGEPSGFPDSQTALQEVDRPFTGIWWGKHPVLRDATGNNDFSDFGSTPFRFQLAPVAAPRPVRPATRRWTPTPSPTR